MLFIIINHDILIAVLSRLGFSSSAHKWFTSYLRDRWQAVRFDQELSSWRELTAGVPQGSILSPSLFSLFINTLTELLTSSYLYADDLELYVSTDSLHLNEAVASLNHNLRVIRNWSANFGISVNPNKCQAIIVGSSRLLPQLELAQMNSIFYDDVPIPYSTQVKDLGLIVDEKLSWIDHVDFVSHRVTNSLRSLYRFKFFLPTRTKIALVQSLILPIIDYADLNSIRELRNLRVVSALFNLLFDPHTPVYLKSRFRFLSDSHDRVLRSTDNLLLHTPVHSSGFVSYSFTVTAVRLWNDLPPNIRKAPNKLAFRALVHNTIHVAGDKQLNNCTETMDTTAAVVLFFDELFDRIDGAGRNKGKTEMCCETEFCTSRFLEKCHPGTKENENRH
ncbi:hypothetical protein evm_014897 [Chilo suppressalis]|nr:hypothetical protein evm_014897 [Chilo suppressalis]